MYMHWTNSLKEHLAFCMRKLCIGIDIILGQKKRRKIFALLLLLLRRQSIYIEMYTLGQRPVTGSLPSSIS